MGNGHCAFASVSPGLHELFATIKDNANVHVTGLVFE